MVHIPRIKTFTPYLSLAQNLILLPFPLAHHGPEILNSNRYFLKALWHIYSPFHGMLFLICLECFSISSTCPATESHSSDTAKCKCHLWETMNLLTIIHSLFSANLTILVDLQFYLFINLPVYSASTISEGALSYLLHQV
jgi:hypothetical protein